MTTTTPLLPKVYLPASHLQEAFKFDQLWHLDCGAQFCAGSILMRPITAKPKANTSLVDQQLGQLYLSREQHLLMDFLYYNLKQILSQKLVRFGMLIRLPLRAHLSYKLGSLAPTRLASSQPEPILIVMSQPERYT